MLQFDKFKNLIPVQHNLKCRENGEYLIIMNEDQELFYLNETARFMYELFDGKTTLQTVFEEMKKEYSIDESLEQDVQADIITII